MHSQLSAGGTGRQADMRSLTIGENELSIEDIYCGTPATFVLHRFNFDLQCSFVLSKYIIIILLRIILIRDER